MYVCTQARTHRSLRVRCVYLEVYRKSEVFKGVSDSLALATGCSHTLDEIFSGKYRVAISDGEVELFLLTFVNQGCIRSGLNLYLYLC